MNYVGLDLSLRATGWAVFHGDSQAHPVRGTFPTLKRKGVERLHLLRQQLAGVMPTGPCVVAVEGYSMGSKGNTFDIGEWGGLAKLHLYERGDCVALLVPPSNLKQYVTGNGGSGKPAVVAAVRALGHDPADDNQADAIGLAMIARHWYRKLPQAAHEARAMQKVKPCFPIPFEPAPAPTQPRTTPRVRTRARKV